MKATDAGTTLAVAEGTVRFEGKTGAVQVEAGQQSTIQATAASPTVPEACDVTALTAWANTGTMPIADGSWPEPEVWLPDDLPVFPSVWDQVEADLDSIDYDQWVEEMRAWFERQFPWVFELQQALAEEGIEVAYPDLMMRSGDLWRFGYPAASLSRQVEPDPNSLLQAAACYDRDARWLQQRAFASLRWARREDPVTGVAAFEYWTEAIRCQETGPTANGASKVLFDSQEACLFLANTRTLAALVLERGAYDIELRERNDAVRLLREELRVLAGCAESLHELDLTDRDGGSCCGAEQTAILVDSVREVAGVEVRLGEIRPW